MQESLKHIILDTPQELLRNSITWKLPLQRKSHTAPKGMEKNLTGWDDFKFYTSQIS